MSDDFLIRVQNVNEADRYSRDIGFESYSEEKFCYVNTPMWKV